MAGGRKREAEALAKLCEKQGFRVRYTRSGFVAYSKDPNGPTVGWHRTASDHRWKKNLISELRRIGVQI